MGFGTILIYVISYFGLFTAIFFFLTLVENRNNLSNPKPKKIPSVTIAVPAYNEEKTITKTVNSLLKLDYPKEKIQIMIIDDGSTDNTYSKALKFKKLGVKIYKQKNSGKAAALNFALKNSHSELFGALDADSFVQPDALKKMTGYFEDKNIMAVTPSLKVYKPKTLLQKIQYIEYMIGIFLRKTFAFLGSIHVTPGPFTIYRKKFFDKHGDYDTNNLTEDIEIALRIQSRGYEIENSVDAGVYTVSPSKFRPLLKQRLRWYVGFVENVWTNRTLFNPKFGNLGMFVLPASFISILLVIVSLFYALNKIVSDTIIKTFIHLRAVGFGIFSLFKFNFDSFYINLSTPVILALASIIMGIIIICIAKKFSKEKTKIKFFYLAYLIFYWILFGFWWILAAVYLITRKKISWGGRSHYVKKANI